MGVAPTCGQTRGIHAKSREKRVSDPVSGGVATAEHGAVAQPRSFIEEPKLFGTSPRAQWKPPVAGAEAATSAAFRQHLSVLSLRVAARRAGLVTDAMLADKLGYATETLRRKMRGESWATTEDLARWDIAFPDDGIYPSDTRLPMQEPDPS
jgi:hypothetical protein